MRILNSRAFLILPFLVLILLPSVALAGGSARAHDGGFFLRMTAGGGGGSTSVDDSVDKLEFSGGAAEFSIAIGGIITENLALHGSLYEFTMFDPDIKFNGTTLGQGDGEISMSGVGAGVTYWFMPVNFYLTGTLGVGTLRVDSGGSSDTSDAGLALELALGKEWFVSDRWGLGIGAGFTFHSIPDGGIDENWSGTSFILRFSATFN